MRKIKKWVLTYDNQNKLVITPHEVPMMFPINRIVGKSGLYPVDIVKFDKDEYLCTFDDFEGDCVLVSKCNPQKNQEGFINLEESDEKRMDAIAERFLKKHETHIV